MTRTLPALVALMLALSVGLLELVRSETVRSYQSMKHDASYQAAEAGIEDYTAKLLEDNNYYLHAVATGEAERIHAASLWCWQRSGLRNTPIRLLGTRVAALTDEEERELRLL